MKKNTLLSYCFAITLTILSGTHACAQGMAINTTGARADTSAILDVASTSKGLLLPRMTTAQRNAIPLPATGLMVYQTDATAGYYYYNGSAWAAVAGGSGWGLTGNTGTNQATNFLGTTDTAALRFRVNNEWAGEINPNTNNTSYGRLAGQSSTTGINNTTLGVGSLSWFSDNFCGINAKNILTD